MDNGRIWLNDDTTIWDTCWNWGVSSSID
jgi:hypothetical protein